MLPTKALQPAVLPLRPDQAVAAVKPAPMTVCSFTTTSCIVLTDGLLPSVFFYPEKVRNLLVKNDMFTIVR
jgi:hypothetical protein